MIEIDLVVHEGGYSASKFCFTLTATDITMGSTANRSVQQQAAIWVFEALQHSTARPAQAGPPATPGLQGHQALRHRPGPQTPLDRNLADERVTEVTKKALRSKCRRIHLGVLYRDIRILTLLLGRLTISKAPAPVRRPVNRSFNHPDDPEVPGEAMNHVLRRS